VLTVGLKRIGVMNLMRFIFRPFRVRLVRTNFLNRSGESYHEIDSGEGAFQSSYRKYDQAGVRSFSRNPMPIGLWKLANVRVVHNSKFPMVLSSGRLNLLPRTESGPYYLYENGQLGRGFQILGPVAGAHLVKLPPRKRRLESAIYVGTRAPQNWSHWLINFLPGVLLADEYFVDDRSVPLLVPENYLSGSARETLFRLFWGSREVQEIGLEDSFRVGRLYWFEQPYSDSPRPISHTHLLPKSANYEVFKRFRERILDYSQSFRTQSEFPKKVFLAREVGYSRQYNVDEVNQVAIEAGYHPVYLNRMSVADQVAIINNAERIVGPHGSALVNVIFCRDGARVLELGNRVSEIEDWDSPLADVAGAEMFITYSTQRDSREGGEFDIDLRTLARVLRDF